MPSHNLPLRRDNVGTRNPNARLTEADVLAVYARCKAGEADSFIAAHLGLQPTAVRNIRLGRAWKHLGLTPIEREHAAEIDRPIADRIAALLSRDGNHECWTGPLDSNGYPSLFMGEHVRPTKQSVARLRWAAEIGPIPEGHLVGSTCGVRLCVAVCHLMCGTRSAILAASWARRGGKADEKRTARVERAVALAVERPCAYCGAPFVPKRPAGKPQKYHSERCRVLASNPPAVRRDENGRFDDYVEPPDTDPDVCQRLKPALRPDGYGQMRRDDGSQTTAHRFAFERRLGRRLNRTEHVLHTCDVRDCVRTDGPTETYDVGGKCLLRFGHLALGTAADNLRDMRAKGRRRRTGPPGGELSEEVVPLIRDAYAAGDFTQAELASMFGVHDSTIQKVVHRLTYRHVD